MRLDWAAPYSPHSGEPSKYQVWRRISNEGNFTLIADTPHTYWVDSLEGADAEYWIGYVW